MERKEGCNEQNRGGFTKLIAVAAVALGVLTLTGCNTTEGAGRDIESLGKGIEETAADAKD